MSAYTRQQYDELCAMIAKGVTSIERNGEKVAFRSLDEMQRIRAEMERSLSIAPARRVHYPTFVKG